MVKEPKRGKCCARKGCTKPPCQVPKHLPRSLRRSDYETDPFCSSVCCRLHYGVIESAHLSQGRSFYTSDK